MNPIWGHIVGIITVVMMVLFIAIWIWAWRKRHKQVFDKMAALPMQDAQDLEQTQDNERGNSHGR